MSLAEDEAVTSDRQLAALAGLTLPELRERLEADPDLKREVLAADARRASALVRQALEAEKCSPAQLLTLAEARYAGAPKGQRSLFETVADPDGAAELETLLEQGDPALVDLLSRFGYTRA